MFHRLQISILTLRDANKVLTHCLMHMQQTKNMQIIEICFCSLQRSGPLNLRCFPVVSTALLDEKFSSAECSWGQALGGGAREVSPLFGGLFAN